MRISLLFACFAAMSVSLLAGCDMLRKDRGGSTGLTDSPGKEPQVSFTKPATEPKHTANSDPGTPVVAVPKDWPVGSNGVAPIVSTDPLQVQKAQPVEWPGDQPISQSLVFSVPDAPPQAMPKGPPAVPSNAPPTVPNSTVQLHRTLAPERPVSRQQESWQPPRRTAVRPSANEPENLDLPTFANITQANTDGPVIINRTPVEVKPLPATWKIVNSTKVFLEYQVENAPSARAAKVEVWLTRDQCQSWQKHMEVTANKKSIEVPLPGDGLFGLTLLVCDGRKTVVPPVAGEQPDGWIEVDTTKPTLQLDEIRTSHDNGQSAVHVRWTARDKNFGDGPVELSYAATPKGPWLPVANNLPGEGQYRWTPPTGVGPHVYMQLIARDTAGNGTILAVQEPISIVPPTPPRAVFRAITTRPDASAKSPD